MIKLYDTLSRQKIGLKKPKTGFLKIFVCGPTVYDHSHIGHAKTYIVFDALTRYLRGRGHKLFYLQNITDVDDKIINRAKKENKTPKKVADFYYRDYLKDMKSLEIKGVDKYARATEYIKEIQNQIERLIKLGFAYKTSSGIYFEIKKFKDYGKLSKQNLGELRSGYRIEPDPEKKDPFDFALWKITDEKEFGWKSPWGWGRPGWHIEDTAITEKYFGSQYDIHGGGTELKFPHHESEIAQQEAISKKPLAKIWMHSGNVLVNGEKMSKSLGNFITIKDFLKKYSPVSLRMIALSQHYRAPLDYNEGMALQAERSLKTIYEFLAKLALTRTNADLTRTNADNKKIAKINQFIKNAERDFEAALDDDFNTPQAFGILFNLINEINKIIWDLQKKDAQKIAKIVAQSFNALGIELKLIKTPAEIEALVEKREELRRNKQFIPADLLRKKIELLGYSIEDTPFGPLVQKNF